MISGRRRWPAHGLGELPSVLGVADGARGAHADALGPERPGPAAERGEHLHGAGRSLRVQASGAIHAPAQPGDRHVAASSVAACPARRRAAGSSSCPGRSRRCVPDAARDGPARSARRPMLRRGRRHPPGGRRSARAGTSCPCACPPPHPTARASEVGGPVGAYAAWAASTERSKSSSWARRSFSSAIAPPIPRETRASRRRDR